MVCGLYGDKLAELYLDGEQITHFNDEFTRTHDIRTPGTPSSPTRTACASTAR